MAGEENLEKAKKAYAAFSEGDAEGAMKDLADDIEWINPGRSKISGTLKGKEEVGEFWGASRTDYLDACLLFLGIWTALISLCNVGWFFRQFRAFRRFETNGEEAANAAPAAGVRPVVEPA